MHVASLHSDCAYDYYGRRRSVALSRWLFLFELSWLRVMGKAESRNSRHYRYGAEGLALAKPRKQRRDISSISSWSGLKWNFVRFRTTSSEGFPPTRRQLVFQLPETTRQRVGAKYQEQLIHHVSNLAGIWLKTLTVHRSSESQICAFRNLMVDDFVLLVVPPFGFDVVESSVNPWRGGQRTVSRTTLFALRQAVESHPGHHNA